MCVLSHSSHVCLFQTPWAGCSPPGSSLHGILQARILEWVAISFFKGSSWPRDWTCVSCIFCFGRQILYHHATWEALLPHNKSLISLFLEYFLQKICNSKLFLCLFARGILFQPLLSFITQEYLLQGSGKHVWNVLIKIEPIFPGLWWEEWRA